MTSLGAGTDVKAGMTIRCQANAFVDVRHFLAEEYR